MNKLSATVPLSNAFCALETGLLEDLSLMAQLQARSTTPAWERMAVVRDLPSAFRPRYDLEFVGRLARAGARITRAETTVLPSCVAEFVLAKWLFDYAVRDCAGNGPANPGTVREIADRLGLGYTTRDPDNSLPWEPWQEGWTLDSIRVDPEHWFTNPFVRTPQS